MLLAAEVGVNHIMFSCFQADCCAIDGYFLPPRRPISLYSQEETISLSVRVPHRRQDCLWAENLFHVRSYMPPIAMSDKLILPTRFVAILFIDALQRMMRVTAESDLAKAGQQDVRTETNLAARKF